MKSEFSNKRLERGRVLITINRLLRSYILLSIALIIGYAFMPLINLLPKTYVPLLGLQPSTMLFLIISALFIYSLIGLIRSILNFLKIQSVILQHLPGLASEHPKTTTKLFLNTLTLMIILILYWIFSPALYLIPEIGEHIAAGTQLAIAAIISLFFWSLGGVIYQSLNKRLNMKIEDYQGMNTLALLKMRILKVFIYLLLTFTLMIIAYALFPAISLGVNITIPGTNLALGIVYWIVVLAAITLSVFSLIRNLIGLFGFEPEILLKIIPILNMQRMSKLKRFSLNLMIVMIILISFFVISPYINLIPNIGIYLGAAGQAVVGAIVVIFFWDIGRFIYFELEKGFKELEKSLTLDKST